MLEVIGRENIKLNQKQINDVIELLEKEEAVSDDKDDKKVEKDMKNSAVVGAKKPSPSEAQLNQIVQNIQVSVPPQISETHIPPVKPVGNTVKDEKKAIGAEPPKL